MNRSRWRIVAALAGGAGLGLAIGVFVGLQLSASETAEIITWRDAQELWLLEKVRLIHAQGPTADDENWMNSLVDSRERVVAHLLSKDQGRNAEAGKLLENARLLRQQRESLQRRF